MPWKRQKWKIYPKSLLPTLHCQYHLNSYCSITICDFRNTFHLLLMPKVTLPIIQVITLLVGGFNMCCSYVLWLMSQLLFVEIHLLKLMHRKRRQMETCLFFKTKQKSKHKTNKQKQLFKKLSRHFLSNNEQHCRTDLFILQL